MWQAWRQSHIWDIAEDMACSCRDGKCIVSLTRQFSNLAPVPKTPMGQIEGTLARAESLEMHTMSSAELRKRCCPTSAATGWCWITYIVRGGLTQLGTSGCAHSVASS